MHGVENSQRLYASRCAPAGRGAAFDGRNCERVGDAPHQPLSPSPLSPTHSFPTHAVAPARPPSPALIACRGRLLRCYKRLLSRSYGWETCLANNVFSHPLFSVGAQQPPPVNNTPLAGGASRGLRGGRRQQGGGGWRTRVAAGGHAPAGRARRAAQ